MDNTLLIRTLADEQELLRAATLTLDAEAQALRDGDMVELERITQTKQKQLAALGDCASARELVERGFGADVALCLDEEASDVAARLERDCFVPA